MAFNAKGVSETGKGIHLLDLLNTLVILANKNIDTQNAYSVLDESFKNEMVNLNQTRDDIFNIYMHGYINSKNIIFNNYIALPPPNES